MHVRIFLETLNVNEMMTLSIELEGRGISLRTFTRMNATVDAIVHRHLFIEPMFDTDDELIEYLLVHNKCSIFI